MSEQEIEKYIDRARSEIVAELWRLTAEQQRVAQEARELDRAAVAVRQHVLSGSYWQLKGVLSEDSITVLSNVEPADREELLGPFGGRW
jgi:hypothetical protein